MQLDLRVRKPTIEGYDDAAAQDTDAAAEEALAVFNEEETIRNGGVPFRHKIGGDIGAYGHDAAGDEVGKCERIFATDLGVDKIPVELGHGGDWLARA